jgi:hypothetical protein
LLMCEYEHLLQKKIKIWIEHFVWN